MALWRRLAALGPSLPQLRDVLRLTAATPGGTYRDMQRKQLEIRFAQISETAVSIIKEERAAREQKTARLRALRLAKEEQDAQSRGRSRRRTKEVRAT